MTAASQVMPFKTNAKIFQGWALVVDGASRRGRHRVTPPPSGCARIQSHPELSLCLLICYFSPVVKPGVTTHSSNQYHQAMVIYVIVIRKQNFINVCYGDGSMFRAV